MSLSNYDARLQPRERTDLYEVVCRNPILKCGRCDGVCGRIEKEDGKRYGECSSCGYTTLLYHAEYGDDMGVEECGEEWTSMGNWVEGAGVELYEERCPRCGHDGDGVECEPVDDSGGY